MPSGDLRKQILIEMRSDSQGVSARAAEEVQRLKREIAGLTAEFAENGGEADVFKAGITGATSELKFWIDTLKSATAAMEEHANAESKIQSAIEKTLIPIHKLEIDTIKMVDAANAAEDRRLAKVEANYYREQAVRDRASVTAANWILKQQTLQMSLVEAEAEGTQVEIASTASKRQLANAAAGAAREQQHLNDVIRDGIGEMMVEQKAVSGAAAGMTSVGNTAMSADARMRSFSFSILAAGYTFQDLTSAGNDWERGITSTLNNVPQLVMGFSGAMGIAYQSTMMAAGAATAFAAATMVVYQNWGLLKDKMGVGIPRPVLDSTAELTKELNAASAEFEKLGKTTRMSLVDLERYKTLNQQILDIKEKQRIEDENAALRTLQSEESERTAAGVKRAIGESGGFEQVAGSTSAAIQAEGQAIGAPVSPQEATKQAEEMIRNAAQGNKGARDMLKRVISEYGQGGAMGSISVNLTKFSPEYERLGEQEREQAEATKREAERKAEADKKAADDRKKAADERKAAKDQSDREHEAEVKGAATTFGQAFGGGGEAGGLEVAIAGRVEKGKSDVDIARDLGKQVKGRLTAAGVEARIVDEVAERIIDAAVSKVRAAAVSRSPDIKKGAAAIVAESEVAATKVEGKVAQTGRQRQIAGGLQQRYGMTEEQAEIAAPKVEKKIRQGVTPRAAEQSVVAEMQKFIQNQNMAMLQLQATQEQLGGMFGAASQQLQMFRQHQAMIRMQMRQNTRPSFMQPFAQGQR